VTVNFFALQIEKTAAIESYVLSGDVRAGNAEWCVPQPSVMLTVGGPAE